MFNFEQVEGVTRPADDLPPKPEDRLQVAELMLEVMPDKPEIAHTLTAQPAYSPSLDRITMPHLSQFESADKYFSTLYHELVHSSGASRRLNRFAEAEGDRVEKEKGPNYNKDLVPWCLSFRFRLWSRVVVLFQLPKCSRWAISLIVNVVSRRNRVSRQAMLAQQADPLPAGRQARIQAGGYGANRGENEPGAASHAAAIDALKPAGTVGRS